MNPNREKVLIGKTRIFNPENALEATDSDPRLHT
jgi:hypothetical protein